MKNLALFSLLLLSILQAELANAACVIASGWKDRSFTMSFPASITYSSNLPVGGVIASQTTSLPTNVIYNCSGDTFTNTGASYYARSDSSGIMITNVSGVGVRTTIYNNFSRIVFPFSNSAPNSSTISFSDPTSVLMEFVKTGPITGGTIDGGNYVGMKGSDGNWFSIFNVPNNIRLIAVGCNVTNTAINVPMGNVSRTSFTNIGPSTTSSNFSIPLNCIAGTSVSVKIDGTADSSGIAGVIKLDASSDTVASGIGLQILNNGMPITLGTPISASTAAPDGPFSIPFTARYYQTASQVIGGKANATATFTMIYN